MFDQHSLLHILFYLLFACIGAEVAMDYVLVTFHCCCFVHVFSATRREPTTIVACRRRSKHLHYWYERLHAACSCGSGKLASSVISGVGGPSIAWHWQLQGQSAVSARCLLRWVCGGR